MLQAVLKRRYNVELKLLDLTALHEDPDLTASHIFDKSSTTEKFFTALMIVLDKQFATATAKREAIESVTLANNGLINLSLVTTLAQTLPQLKNLDLSNNAFKDLASLEAWRRKFPKLDHLIVSPNPLEQNEPDYATTIMAWYPKLRFLNSIQVRSDDDVMNGFQMTDLPFPIRTPSFQDEGQIAENFIRTFFAGYDSDRNAVAQHYYDDQSVFTLAVNTQAPRDPNSTQTVQPQEWDRYIKFSANLKKISQPKARQDRQIYGTNPIADVWAALPVTRHPDLATEAAKWLIECTSIPGLPDPTGASPAGVDGFLITVHGEFQEIDVATNQVKKLRSFDRVFTLGPGGASGVRVVTDILTIRAYGGTQAWVPDEVAAAQAPVAVNGVDPIAAAAAPPAIPPGLTPEVAEQMVLELQKQTSMTLDYAKDCLTQVDWDFERALQAFAAVRANLPPEAFIVPPQV